MQRKHRPRRVLLVLGWYDYRLHRGIEQYAQEHRWHLSEDLAREKVIPWGWDGDGILAWLGAGDDLAEFVAHAEKPTVDFSFRRPHLKFARVLEDTAAVGRLVAEHFLARGFRHFLYYSDADNWVYNERGRAFFRVLEQAGRTGQWLRWQESSSYGDDRHSWKRKHLWLADKLRRAAKPIGVFGASDGRALEVLEACASAGIAVPDQVAVVGAGESLLAVEAMPVPVSSVDVNMQTIGYRGAALLDDLMQQMPKPADAIRVPPLGLIARRSSDLFAVDHPGLARSLRFMAEHCHEPIGVDDLARVAAMSRRGFHHAFVEKVGRPPGHELQALRIARAKTLLTESQHKMETIAAACGYQSANSFSVAFRQATQMSPRQYRTSMTAHPHLPRT